MKSAISAMIVTEIHCNRNLQGTIRLRMLGARPRQTKTVAAPHSRKEERTTLDKPKVSIPVRESQGRAVALCEKKSGILLFVL